MITLALLLAAAPAPELVARADRDNERYVACLFASSRSASWLGLSSEQFKARLATACLAEEQATVRSMSQVLSERNEADAASKSRRAAAQARSDVVTAYRSLEELGPKLKQIEKLCRQQPDACR